MRTRWWGMIGLALLGPAARAQPGGDAPSVFLPAPAESVFLPADADAPLKDLTPAELPPAHPGGSELEDGLMFAGEFLLLTPRSSALDFALVDGKNDLIPNGEVQSLHLRTQAGLRFAAGYRTPRGWDVGFAYAYFNTTDSFAVAAPAGALLYPTLTRPGLIDQARTASARAKLTINSYDATFGKTWDAAEDVRLRLYGGLRFASVRSRLDATYDGRDADAANALTQSKFFGVGPLLGAEASVNLGSGVGLFGKANGGLLTGGMPVKLRETNNAGGTLYTNVHDDNAATVPFLQLGLGVEYRYNGVFLRAGYEVTQFLNVVDRPVFLDDFAEGKLTRRVTNVALDGLFLQAGFSY